MSDAENSSARTFYMDFSLDGGVVSINPTKESAQALVLPWSTFRSDTDTKVEKYSERVSAIIPPAMRLAVSAKRSSNFARTKLREILGISDGFIDIGEDYYFGYFRVIKPETSGSRSPLNQENRALQLYGVGPVATVSRIFKLEPEALTRWSPVIGEKPIDYSQWIELRTKTGDETTHPLYQSLLGVKLTDRLKSGKSYLDKFWADVKPMLDSGDKSIQEAYLRSNIITLAVFNRVIVRDSRSLLSQVSKKMFEIGVTALSTGEGAIIGYTIDSSHIRYRSLPIPLEHIRAFQRYLYLGEKPLTKSEVEALYRKFVNPNTNQFGDRSKHSQNILQEQRAMERGDFVSALHMRLQRNQQNPPKFKIIRVGMGSAAGFEAACEVVRKDGKTERLSVYARNIKDVKRKLSEKIYDTLTVSLK